MSFNPPLWTTVIRCDVPKAAASYFDQFQAGPNGDRCGDALKARNSMNTFKTEPS